MDPDDKAGPAHEAEEAPTWALDSTNLADERLGSSVLFATDEWFATAERLFLRAEPIFRTDEMPGAYTVQGKWMDGCVWA